MTANDLLKHQLEDTTYQLEKVLEDVKEDTLDYQPVQTAMSIRQQIAHLCEVYTAVEEQSRGIDHAWGEYTVEDTSWGALLPLFTDLRMKAIEVVSGAEEDKDLIAAVGFMAGHEYYHIGQLASLRIATDSAWDPYSIYRHG